jgi:hypothetical protein
MHPVVIRRRRDAMVPVVGSSIARRGSARREPGRARHVAGALVVLLACACAGAACSSGPPSSTSSAGLAASDPCGGTDPAFVFYSIDSNFFPADACRSLLATDAGPIASGGPTAPSWTKPTEGESLDGLSWVTFSWSATPDGGVEADADVEQDDGFVVEFRQGDVEILRVLLRGTRWPVDVASWTRLKAAPGTLAATVVRVPLAGNELDPTALPVASSPVGFTISSD